MTGKGEANGSGRAVYDPLHLHLNPGEVEPVRVAVVGLGYWGPNLARNLQECAEAELTALCDLSGEHLARLGRRYPAAALYQSLDSLLADTEIEAVAIATPVGTHHRIASAALNAGKHVFVEKPLAASSQEAHLPVQPAGTNDPHPDRLGRDRRDLFHLDQPRQPRAASTRCQRRLGPWAARLLDLALLAW